MIGASAVVPTRGVMRYCEMALPPLEAGAVQVRSTVPFPATPCNPVGASGAEAAARLGVTAAEAAESGPTPTLLIAATRKVYCVPLESPSTVWLVAGESVVIGVCAVAPTYGVIR